jgi:hypothetical protein
VKPARDRTLPKDGPGADWLGGRNLSDLQAASSSALRSVLRARGVPFVTVRLPSVTPSAIGALHMATMLSAAFAGGLCGGEPFAPGRPRSTQPVEDEVRRASSA